MLPFFEFKTINADLFTHDSEKVLVNLLQQKQGEVDPLLVQKSYADALLTLAQLRDPIDEFFDNVMVMDKNDAIKINRLAILNQLRQLFISVADIALLDTRKDS